MGKKTIREFVSRVIFDRRIDPADIILYVLDSSKVRIVPFNFVKFEADGFIYKGNFYPLYKILAIQDTFTGKFYLLRNMPSNVYLNHSEIDLNDFPYTLEFVYENDVLIRNTPLILKFIEHKLMQDSEFSWESFFSRIEEISFKEFTLKVVLDDVFKYVAVIYRDSELYGVFRLLPLFHDLELFLDVLQYQRIVVPKVDTSLDEIMSCFFGKGFLCIDDSLEFVPLDEIPINRRQQLELLGYYIYLTRDNGFVLGIGDMSEKRILSPRRELQLLEKAKLTSLFDLDSFYTKEDLDWLISIHGILRVSDWDQIYVHK